MTYWNLLFILFTLALNATALDVIIDPYKYLDYQEIKAYNLIGESEEECDCGCEYGFNINY